MPHYQGHLPDGSSVQAHSAGPVYPFVVYGRTVNGTMYWEVLGPGVEDYIRFETGEDAQACANNLKVAYDSFDHWCRLLRGLLRGPSILTTQLLVDLALQHGFSQVVFSGVQRVRSLLVLGKAQAALRQLRDGSHHPLTEYAYREARESRFSHH